MKMEWALFLDPHTNGVVYEQGNTCKKCKCFKMKDAFYDNADFCKLCYDRKWMEKNDIWNKFFSHRKRIEDIRKKANRRSKYRQSTGELIDDEEVERLWEECGGKCRNCNSKMTFEWFPREFNENYAVLDRINTANNQTYKGNAQFLCTGCNTEKGGWDFAHQQCVRVEKLKRKVKRLQKKVKKRCIRYESILINWK